MIFPVTIGLKSETGAQKTVTVRDLAQARELLLENIDLVIDVLCDGPWAARIEWPIRVTHAVGKMVFVNPGVIRKVLAVYGGKIFSQACGLKALKDRSVVQ